MDAWLGPLRFASLYDSRALTRHPSDPAPAYLNTVAVGQIGPRCPSPEHLLSMVKALELAAGREPAARWAPRPLDVDLLFVGQKRRELPVLSLPHPELSSRRFVLEPLAELVPDLLVPPTGTPIARLLEQLDGPAPSGAEAVERRGDRSWYRAASHGARG